MLTNKRKTKILMDGGDPDETLQVKKLIGFVDGQTTNPSLIPKNPEIQQRIASGHSLTSREEKDEYRKMLLGARYHPMNSGLNLRLASDAGRTSKISLKKVLRSLRRLADKPSNWITD